LSLFCFLCPLLFQQWAQDTEQRQTTVGTRNRTKTNNSGHKKQNKDKQQWAQETEQRQSYLPLFRFLCPLLSVPLDCLIYLDTPLFSLTLICVCITLTPL
jgi:hypothetical protein